LKSFIKSKNKEARADVYVKYRVYRVIIVSLCKLSKNSFYLQYFHDNSNNIKKIWVGVKEIIASRSLKKTPISLQIGNLISSDPNIVSESLNNFFVSIAAKIKAKIPVTRYHFSNYLKNSNTNSFYLIPTTSSEVALLIQSLKINKACGPYSIPVYILQLIKTDISLLLSKLINLSFTTGVFPSILKEAKVIPVFRKRFPSRSGKLSTNFSTF
jgi:hypothetical protein